MTLLPLQKWDLILCQRTSPHSVNSNMKVPNSASSSINSNTFPNYLYIHWMHTIRLYHICLFHEGPSILCFVVEHPHGSSHWCCSKLPQLKNPVGIWFHELCRKDAHPASWAAVRVERPRNISIYLILGPTPRWLFSCNSWICIFYKNFDT